MIFGRFLSLAAPRASIFETTSPNIGRRRCDMVVNIGVDNGGAIRRRNHDRCDAVFIGANLSVTYAVLADPVDVFNHFAMQGGGAANS